MPPTIPAELETEMKYFNDHRAELLDKAPGKFLLVKGDTLLGTFDSETAAIRQGYEMLGNVPFLVKQVTEADIPLNFALHLGV